MCSVTGVSGVTSDHICTDLHLNMLSI